MSFEDYLERIRKSKNTNEIDNLKEEISRKFGVYVIIENIGICKICGKEDDLRYGYCWGCVPDWVKEKISSLIGKKGVKKNE